jgi:hypothetical protein
MTFLILKNKRIVEMLKIQEISLNFVEITETRIKSVYLPVYLLPLDFEPLDLNIETLKYTEVTYTS